MPVIKSLRKYTDMFFDVHLMIDKPERYIDEFINAGADSVTFHIEATDKPEECIKMIQKRGKKRRFRLIRKHLYRRLKSTLIKSIWCLL